MRRVADEYADPALAREMQGNTFGPYEIERRLAKAEREMGRANRFDVVLINDDLETACGDLSSLAAEFLGPQRVEA